MKKKTRNITVDGTHYKWSVVELMWPECELKIWIDGNKTQPWYVVKFDSRKTITPSVVAAIILDAANESN